MLQGTWCIGENNDSSVDKFYTQFVFEKQYDINEWPIIHYFDCR